MGDADLNAAHVLAAKTRAEISQAGARVEILAPDGAFILAGLSTGSAGPRTSARHREKPQPDLLRIRSTASSRSVLRSSADKDRQLAHTRSGSS
jgi:hypothetical protein